MSSTLCPKILLMLALCFLTISDYAFSSHLKIAISNPTDVHVSHRFYHQSISVEAGTNLTLKCLSADETALWRYTNSGVLELPDVRSSDADLYDCCVKLDPEKCINIYVFVRNDLTSAGIISRSSGVPIILSLVQRETAIIPCKPNSPDMFLELKSVTSGRRIEESGYRVTFDPTVGFTVQRPYWTEEWVHTKCTAANASDNIDVLVYWVVAPLFAPVIKISSPVTEIDPSSTLKIMCAVESAGGTISVYEWVRDAKPLKSERMKVVQEGQMFVLLLENVTSEDSGEYSCRVFVAGTKDPVSSAALKIRVNGYSKVIGSSVPLTISRVTPLVMVTETDVNVSLTVGANLSLCSSYERPRDCNETSHVWKKKRVNGSLYEGSDGAFEGEEEDHGNLTRLRLRKDNVGHSDAGVYELWATSCGRNGSIFFVVTITDPAAHVDHNGAVPIRSLLIMIPAVMAVALFVPIVICMMKRPLGLLRSTNTAKCAKLSSAQKTIVKLDNMRNSTLSYKSLCTGRIISGSKLHLSPGILGKGAYGCVAKASLNGQDVAVKRMFSVHRTENIKNLTEELAILDYLQSNGKHRNIVEMIGVVFDPEVMIVFEFCSGGSLSSFLESAQFLTSSANDFKMRVTKSLTTSNQGYYNFANLVDQPVVKQSDLLSYATQISAAMQFIAARNVIHRDVAARNVLVASPHHVKLCDFGLSKKCAPVENFTYRTPGSKCLPYKHMPPESLLGLFTMKSDVWAFGVFVWEVFELGRKSPYSNIGDPQVLFNFLHEGHRLPCPLAAPFSLYDLMLSMWNADASKRPDFDMISDELSRISNLAPE